MKYLATTRDNLRAHHQELTTTCTPHHEEPAATCAPSIINMSTENVEMDNRSRIFCDLFMKANDYFDNNEFEESYRIFSLLLDYADLSDYHRAGCHRILSLGEDNFLWHAERAVDLYENLFVVRPGSSYTGEFPPTEKAIRAQNILLGLAKESLESARKDTAEIKADYEAQHRAFLTNHGRKPTDEELQSSAANSPNKPSNLQRELMAWESEAGDG
ncbi:hypothetical protein D6D28_02600 [Aureobasidium pullulans]|uniref:Uncharacterized protein n=1 Tax=Aureobasidium pullulans TaxID=5580 RepID=A0A4V4I0X6_AURPU|nr:hypothetical protein D6D28_02600 [Aureobasidium pullulans]